MFILFNLDSVCSNLFMKEIFFGVWWGEGSAVVR